MGHLKEEAVIMKRKSLLSIIANEKTYAGKKKLRSAVIATPKTSRKKKTPGLKVPKKEDQARTTEVMELRYELTAIRKATAIVEKELKKQQQLFEQSLEKMAAMQAYQKKQEEAMLQLQKVLGKEDRPHKDLINTMAKHMDVIDQKVNTVADSPPQPLDPLPKDSRLGNSSQHT